MLSTKWYRRERRLALPAAGAHCQLWRDTLRPAARRGKFQLPEASHALAWLLEVGAWEVGNLASDVPSKTFAAKEGGQIYRWTS